MDKHGVLIDLDGVIWESDQVVEGAPATIAWLQNQLIPYLFVTNTTSRPARLIVDKLARLGIPTELNKLLTPPIAACEWLAKNAPGPTALVVPEATREDFSTVVPANLDGDGDIAAIVVGDIGEAWNYDLLNLVFRRLMAEPRPQLIALGMTRYWRAADGLRLDVAPFIKALEHAAEIEAVVLGKPAPAFFEIGLARTGCRAAETVMVGDDLQGDVLGAQQVGMRGLLTRTGKFRPQDMDSRVKPDALLDSVADLPAWLGKE